MEVEFPMEEVEKKVEKQGVELTQTQFEVLKGISDFLTPKEISEKRKTSFQATYSILRRLIKIGYIDKNPGNTTRYGSPYNITKKGMEGLNSFIGFRYNLRKHNLHFKCKVLESPRNWEQKRNQLIQMPFFNKRVEIKNNYYDLFSYGKLQLKTTSQSIIIKIPTIYARTVDSAVLQSMDILFSSIPKIEALFKVKLVKNYKCNITIISNEVARLNDSLAKLYRKEANKLYITGEDGKVWLIADYSLNTDELETIHPTKSDDDMDIVHPFFNDLRKNPTTFSEVRDTVHEILEVQQNDRQTMNHLNVNLETHFEVLHGIKDAILELKNEVKRMKGGGKNAD